MKSSSSNKKKTTADKKSSVIPASKTVEKMAVEKTTETPVKSANLFPVVGIGASAGGLDAFKKLLKEIPEDSGIAYVLVQHLDPKHESMLPELLQKVTKIPVIEITDDIKVQPDHIYVIPSNKMMVATDGVLLLAPRPEKSKNERNLPIDLFFTSLAEVHQEHAIGVVLSGTASDGTQGLKAIKEHGGITFAQDEASAEYEGMPHSAAQAGVVDFILPPEEIPQKLLEVTSKIKMSDEELQNIPKADEDVFKQILSLLRIRKGVDFTYYKQTTIRRRILRRMLVNKNVEPVEYLNFLRGNTPEQDLLYQDMLIPVTSFFRDKKVFEDLCNNVFPTILKNKIPGDITRIWVAGCSTGQEVYSFAICFKEFLGDNYERLQIFGTDLSEPAIIKARSGIYEKTELDSVSPHRLKEYFTKTNGGYQVNKSIRDMCVFAHHNFLKDPPFGKMDCISCRNVLIYMEPYLQKKALTTFHYALIPKGYLLLGKSETTGGVPDLFASASKTDKLYTRKDVPGRFMQIASQRSEQILTRAIQNSKSENNRTDFQKTADDILLTKYTPAGVVVDEAMDIVHFRGNTANYLEQASGKPSHNLLIMAKHGLGFELRNILHKAKTDKAAVVKENIPLYVNSALRNISIEAVPLPNTLEPYYLVLFHDNNLNDTEGPSPGSGVISNRKKVSAKTKKDEKDIRIQLLEQELSQLREDMRSITEDQEASNEELQSANEELLSGSEELQSLNEELETSKEELQSTNEELTVLNNELIGLNEQVTDARNYSESIVATLYQPLLVLDKNLRVKTANKAFYKTFKVNEQETQGVLVYDLGNRQWNIPELRTLLEEILPQKTQISDFEVTHNFSSIGERVILLNALEITREKKEEKLILLSIEDITDKVTARKKIEDTCERYHNILMESPFAFSIMKGKEMLITNANKQIKDFWGKGDDVVGKTLLKVLPELADQPFPAMLDSVYSTGKPVYANEILARLNHNGTIEERYFNIVYQPNIEADETISGVITIAHEVTNQVLARRKIEESEERFQAAVAAVEGIVWTNNSKGEMEGEQAGWSSLTGQSYQACQGYGWANAVHPDDAQPTIDAWNEAVKERKSFVFEHRVRLKNGNWGHFSVKAIPLLNADGLIREWVGVHTDISERKQSENLLKESEFRYHNMVYSSPSLIAIFKGEDMMIEIANDAVLESWGKGKDIIGKSIFTVLPETVEQGFDKILLNVYNTGEPFYAYETPVTLIKNGQPQLMHYTFIYQAQRDINGEIEGVAILANEVTPQVEAKIKLNESEQRFRNLVEKSHYPMCIFKGKEMVLELANEPLLQILNVGKESLGKSLLEIMPEMKDQPFMELLLDVFEKGITHYGNEQLAYFLRENGEIQNYYFNFVYQPYYENEGTIAGVMASATDVTEQVLARKKVEVQNQLFNDMLMTAPGFVATLAGPNHVYELVNAQYQSLVGKRQIQGKPIMLALPELEGQGFDTLLDKVYNTGEPYVGINIPMTLARDEGVAPDEMFFNFSFQPMYDEHKNIFSILVFGYEVTAQVIATKKIEESEAFNRAVLDSSPDCIKMLDAEGRLQFMNSNGICLLEIDDFKRVENTYWWDMWETDNRQIIKDAVAKAKSGEKIQLQLFGTTVKGTPKWWDIIVLPVQEDGDDKNSPRILSVSRDITNQKLNELKEMELLGRFQNLVMQAPVAICVLQGRDYVVEVINEVMLIMWDRKIEDIINIPAFDVLPEFRDQGLKELLDTVYNTGERVILQEFPLTIRRFERMENIFVNFVYEPIREADGTITGVMALAHEITEQVLSRKKIEESEEKFSTLVENMDNLAWLADGEGYIYWYNKRWYDYTGTTLEEMKGWGWKKVHHPDHVDRVVHFVKEAWYKNKAFELTFPLRGADGEYRWFLTRAYPIADEQGKVMRWIGTNTNIDDQKKTEVEIKYHKALLEAHNEASMDGILLVDMKGKILSYNHKFIEIWNMPPEIVQAEDDEAALDFAMQQLVNPEQFIEKVKYLYDNPTETSTDLLEFKNGKIVERHGYAVTAKDGSYYAWSWTFRDITIQKGYEKNIKQSEEYFKFMANSMPQKVWTADALGAKTYFNKTLLDYAGKSFEELKGDGWHQIIHPEDWEINKIQWEECIRTGKDYETENRLLRKDGKYLWHLTRAVALKDEAGEIKMWVGSKTEIQEQREQKEELEYKIKERTGQLINANEELLKRNAELFITKEKLMSEYARSLIEASLDPLVTINTDGKLTDMNHATVDITGVSREKLNGSNFFHYFTEPQKAREVYEEVFAKGSVVNAPLTLRHIDGKLTDIFLNGSVYKNPAGNVTGVVLVARDVTEEKRIATELNEAIVFAEMATAIAEDEKMKAEESALLAEEAVKAKQQFLSNMSHEIRTPMNAIIGFTKVVLKTDLTLKQREYLTAIKLSGNSLIVLINDILDLAKVDAGKMSFEEIPFKMASSIAAMIHLFEIKIQEKNLALVKEYDDKIPEVLLGDPVRLHQIILNLVSNAVKFTSTGKITISLQLVNEDAEYVSIQFSVADTGTGIPEDKTEKIFEKFHQASSDTSRLYGGTGLGLAIVKQLVESQGGNIEVKSKPGEGSVFSFTLSFKKTDAEAETETEILEIDSENKNIKVLVVEDIALNQLLMKTLLDDFGFERDIAANGKIAIEKMQEKDYDIILMDLQMPEMNGFEATEYIRKNMHSNIPIIALTADVTTVDLEKCKAVGMNDYIAKPVDERILYSKMIGLVMKPGEKTTGTKAADKATGSDEEKYTDLAYLISITKYDHSLMMEMIALYLEQTPVLIATIKKSMQDEDRESLQAAVHKMIPSFSIMGINKAYEAMAKQIHAYTGTKNETAAIKELIAKLETICASACAELKEEYITLQNTKA